MKLETEKLSFSYNFLKLKVLFYHITPFIVNAVKFSTGIQNDTAKNWTELTQMNNILQIKKQMNVINREIWNLAVSEGI